MDSEPQIEPQTEMLINNTTFDTFEVSHETSCKTSNRTSTILYNQSYGLGEFEVSGLMVNIILKAKTHPARRGGL